jgi:hypothetical protein
LKDGSAVSPPTSLLQDISLDAQKDAGFEFLELNSSSMYLFANRELCSMQELNRLSDQCQWQ